MIYTNDKSSVLSIKEMLTKAKVDMLDARDFPNNTTPSSRLLEFLANQFAAGDNKVEEPEYKALAIYNLLTDYYNLGRLKNHIEEI